MCFVVGAWGEGDNRGERENGNRKNEKGAHLKFPMANFESISLLTPSNKFLSLLQNLAKTYVLIGLHVSSPSQTRHPPLSRRLCGRHASPACPRGPAGGGGGLRRFFPTRGGPHRPLCLGLFHIPGHPSMPGTPVWFRWSPCLLPPARAPGLCSDCNLP